LISDIDNGTGIAKFLTIPIPSDDCSDGELDLEKNLFQVLYPDLLSFMRKKKI